MTDSNLTKRFETPLMDSLKPQYQDLVRAYAGLLDKTEAAKSVGFSNKHYQLKATVQRLFSDPAIIAAIDEYLGAKLEQIDQGRAAICQRLLNQSLATMYDLTKRVPYRNGNGTTIRGKFSLVPKEYEDVEERFRCAMCFVTRNTDGTYGWDNSAQHRCTLQLSKLMMWDQTILEQSPPLIFNFGNIQQKPYEAPDDGVDPSALGSSEDEIDKLTKH